MSARWARVRDSVRELVTFATVGVLNTGVDVAVFFGLTSLGVPYLGAQVVSYSCGAGNSYVLNKFWTFRTGGLSWGEMLRFTAANLASLGISLACLRTLHGSGGTGLAVAKIGATGCALAANFLASKLWVFR
ncbi:MAG: GtrA family protein [Deltaproteobacteria bacterium]|nr:GtrA family protein [Deltaproteobacteria bacterium]